ncbi:MAG: hydroxymethylglutaryl-CoA reductase, degradative [Phototrophicaceae bacterium]
MNNSRTSRLSGFYKHTPQERLSQLQVWADLTEEDVSALCGLSGLTLDQANNMVENAVGVLGIPLGIATNFRINGRDYLIPMAVEEPSVIAAVSNAAKLFREDLGFVAHSDDPIMIGQIQLLDIADLAASIQQIEAHKTHLLTLANEAGGSIIRRGGGARDLEIHSFEETPIGKMLIVHILFDTRDAMGANAINTVAESLSPELERITDGRAHLRILSNLTDRRKAYARGSVAFSELGEDGEQVAKGIIEAAVFAEVDPYRAATHNKGVMNGIDAVVMATANDWRAVEAGAHAYACRHGRYTSFTKWWIEDDRLHGSIELPMSLGIVGGATRVHPTAQVVLKILQVESATELAQIAVVVGLAQNFAAMRALATTGIQAGHMRLHAKQLAVAAGATTLQVEGVVRQMLSEKQFRLERAIEIVTQLNQQEGT